MLRADAPMDLILGEVITLPASDIREYGTDGEDIVDVRADPKDHPTTLAITARKVGTTTLFLVDEEGRVVRRAVRVGTRTYAPTSPQSELATELAELSCVRVARDGSALVILASGCSDTERLQLEERRDDFTARQIELRFVEAAPDAGEPKP